MIGRSLRRHLGFRVTRFGGAALGCALVALAVLTACCSRQLADPAKPQRASGLFGLPHVTLVAVTDWQAVLKPCGCTVDLQKGGIERISKYINDLRKTDDSVLVVHAGSLLGEDDSVGDGKAAQVERRVQAFDEALARIGVAAVALPSAGLDASGPWVRRTYNNARWPVVGAEGWNGGIARALPSLLLKSRSGVQVGLLAADPAAFADEARRSVAMAASVQALRKRGANVVVVLSNLGLRQSRRLARSVAGIDVLVIGNLDQKAEPVTDLEREGETLLVQASRHGAWLAAVTLAPGQGAGTWREVSEYLPGASEDLQARIAALETSLKSWRQRATLATQRALPYLEADLAEHKRRLGLALGAAGKSLPSGRLVGYRTVGLPWTAAVDARVAAIVKRYDDDIALVNLRVTGSVPLPGPGQAAFIGERVCLTCHTEAAGFAGSDPHGKAWATLERDGKTRDLDCVPCHVTGYGQAGGSNLAHLENLMGVQCEACHGPGSLHVEAERQGKSGHIVSAPGAALCETCHTLVHAPRFSFEDYRKRLIQRGHGAPVVGGAAP